MTPSYLSGLSKVHYQKNPDYIRDKLYENLRKIDRSKSSSLINNKKFLQAKRSMGQANSISIKMEEINDRTTVTNRYRKSTYVSDHEHSSGPYVNN